jgi:hypothetical protein
MATSREKQSRILGISSIVLGCIGVVCSSLLYFDEGSPAKYTTAHYVYVRLFAVSLVAHVYLIVSGFACVIRLNAHWLAYYFIFAWFYLIGFITIITLLVGNGSLRSPEGHWYVDINVGFTFQAVVGFPIWGSWLVYRLLKSRPLNP